MRQNVGSSRELRIPSSVGLHRPLGRGAPSLLRLFIAFAALLFVPVLGSAQTVLKDPSPGTAAQTLPDAPDRNTHTMASGDDGGGASQAQSDNKETLKKPEPQNPVPSGQPGQTKRILGIIPNFRSVSTSEILPAQTVKEKFLTATDDSFDYSAIFIPALLAVYSEQTGATPEFGTGAVGYGRYFWHAAVDQTSENYMVEFIVPAMTREDTRYYTLGHGGFFKRTGYALSRAVVTRTDSAHATFNFSEVVGAGASAGLSNLYYPTRERSVANTGTEWGLDIAIDAASYVAKEFWPDINHRMLHGKATT